MCLGTGDCSGEASLPFHEAKDVIDKYGEKKEGKCFMGKIKPEWVYCTKCKRNFAVELSEEARTVVCGEECIKDAGVLAGESLKKFEGVYPRCPYPECDGTRLHFHWWSDVREQHLFVTGFEYPEIPKQDVIYPNPFSSEKGST